MASNEGFSEAEKEAMKATARERRVSKKQTPEQQAAEVQAVIDKMPETERQTAQRIHDLILTARPELAPKTWYGMPAYALNGKVVCFFQNPTKYQVRYFVLGFNDSAQLDDGSMWPTSFAIQNLDKGSEARISELVKLATD